MHVNMAIVMAIVAQNRREKNTYILFLLYGSILKVMCCEGALQWADSSTKRTQRTPKKTHITMAIAMAIVMAIVAQNRRGKTHTFCFYYVDLFYML